MRRVWQTSLFHPHIAMKCSSSRRLAVALLTLLQLAVVPSTSIPLLSPSAASNSQLSVSSNSSSVLLQRAVVENNAADVVDWSPPATADGLASGGRNDLEVGQCATPDERIYTDNTIVENGGPSTLNGTLEVKCFSVKSCCVNLCCLTIETCMLLASQIYIDAPIRITCIRIEDQIADGTGAIPSIRSGGLGESWVFVGVEAKYGQGFNFNIHIFGVPDERQINQQINV